MKRSRTISPTKNYLVFAALDDVHMKAEVHYASFSAETEHRFYVEQFYVANKLSKPKNHCLLNFNFYVTGRLSEATPDFDPALIHWYQSMLEKKIIPKVKFFHKGTVASNQEYRALEKTIVTTLNKDGYVVLNHRS